MQMVGHQTEEIYKRYAIVSDADLRAAANELVAIEPERERAHDGHSRSNWREIGRRCDGHLLGINGGLDGT